MVRSIILCDSRVPTSVRIQDGGLVSVDGVQAGETVFENELLKIDNETWVYMCVDGQYRYMHPTRYTVNRQTYREFFYFDSYMNHSCDPNARHEYLTDTVYRIVAVRPIRVGEQITIDYATIDQDNDDEPFECLCGSSKCRKVY